MPLSITNNNLDVVLKQDKTNRDAETPSDILIAAYANLVDKKRQSIRRSTAPGGKIMGGVANKAHSVINTVKRAVNEGRFELHTNKLILDNDTKVYTKHYGLDPIITISGDNNEFVTIEAPQGCTLDLIKVQGLPTEVDSLNQRTVIFKGKGILGNTSIKDILVPTVLIGSIITSIEGPSTSVPWSFKSADTGDFEIVGIGNNILPSLSLRFTDVNLLEDQHVLQFIW